MERICFAYKAVTAFHIHQLPAINFVKPKWQAYCFPGDIVISYGKIGTTACLLCFSVEMVSRKVSASSFINLNDWNITSKKLLANTFVKTKPANKYLLTQSQKTNTICKRCSKLTMKTLKLCQLTLFWWCL